MAGVVHPDDPRYGALPWRVGRKVGRTLYCQLGSAPSDDDVLVGMMDTRALAELAVSAHNAQLRAREEET